MLCTGGRQPLRYVGSFDEKKRSSRAVRLNLPGASLCPRGGAVSAVRWCAAFLTAASTDGCLRNDGVRSYIAFRPALQGGATEARRASTGVQPLRVACLQGQHLTLSRHACALPLVPGRFADCAVAWVTDERVKTAANYDYLPHPQLRWGRYVLVVA